MNTRMSLARRHCLALIAAAGTLIGSAAAAQAPPQPAPPGPQLVVTYVEAPVASAATVERVVRDYARTLLRDRNAPAVEVLREIGRPERMAVIERWPDAAAVPADGELNRRLDGRLQAPLDRRVHRAIGPLVGRGSAGPFRMLMHVDVVPPGAPMANRELDAHRAAVLGSRGGRGFEVAVQPDRPNHFGVHQMWASRAAYEAYAASPAARELRRQLSTAKGGLYDDRFYTPVPIMAAPARPSRRVR